MEVRAGKQGGVQFEPSEGGRIVEERTGQQLHTSELSMLYPSSGYDLSCCLVRIVEDTDVSRVGQVAWVYKHDDMI